MTPYDSKKYWKTIHHTECYKVKNRNPLKSVKFANSNLSGQNFSFFLLHSEMRMIKYDPFIEFQAIHLVHLLSVTFAVNLKWNKEVFLYLINSLAYKLTMTSWHANLAGLHDKGEVRAEAKLKHAHRVTRLWLFTQALSESKGCPEGSLQT